MCPMAMALENGKITGAMGIAAALAYIVCMLLAAFLLDGFEFGVNKLEDLSSEMIYIAGCVIAGALGVVFGILVSLHKVPSKTFIEKVRGVMIIVSGILLVVVGAVDLPDFNAYIIWAFIGIICLTVLTDVAYNWVVDQKIQTIITAILFLIIALTGCLSQTSDNIIIEFVFVAFIAIWVVFAAAMYFAPVEAKPTMATPKKGAGKPNSKKNEPTPRPYPAKRPEAKPAVKPAPVVKEQPKKVEEPPKKVEEPVKEEPKAVIPPKKVEEPVKEELPKLKIMSSREAAMARDARKKEEVIEPEPIVQSITESAPEPVAAVPEEVIDDSDDEGDEDLSMYEDTPDALLRRATWNKGLRCRRDYGDHQIPIAFVKAKVAVYVTPEPGNTSIDDTLRSEGWAVFRYLESDITDGKDQAEDINRVVKENLKAMRTPKKKKTAKKK